MICREPISRSRDEGITIELVVGEEITTRDGIAVVAHLLRVRDHVDRDRHRTPSFTPVVTDWGYAYRRPDGVFMIPIGAHAP